MKSVLRLAACIAVFLAAASAFAHGGEKHGAEEISAAPTALSRVRPHHDMIAKSGPAAPSKATDGYDVEQVQSEGIAGTLKALHPATVHFPIALFLMAALTELFVLSRPTPDRVAAVRIMIYGGAAGGIVAALFGWIHTGLWFGGDTLMQLHRWNGMLIAVLGLAAAWVAHQQHDARLILRLLLFRSLRCWLSRVSWAGSLPMVSITSRFEGAFHASHCFRARRQVAARFGLRVGARGLQRYHRPRERRRHGNRNGRRHFGAKFDRAPCIARNG